LHENGTKRLEAEDMDKDIPGKYLPVMLFRQLKDEALEFAQAFGFVFYNSRISQLPASASSVPVFGLCGVEKCNEKPIGKA
jgi:hypothetical protein